MVGGCRADSMNPLWYTGMEERWKEQDCESDVVAHVEWQGCGASDDNKHEGQLYVEQQSPVLFTSEESFHLIRRQIISRKDDRSAAV